MRSSSTSVLSPDPAPVPGLHRGGGGRSARAGRHQVDWPELLDAAHRTRSTRTAGVLVVVTLYGGNDGLNTVVPAADPAYQKARPDLAYRPGRGARPRRRASGLNPGMTGPQGAVGRRPAGRRPRRRLPAGRPQPLPVDGHLADRVTGPAGHHRLAGSLAGRHHHRSADGGVAGVGAAAAAGRREARGRLVPAVRPETAHAASWAPRWRSWADPDPADGPWQARVASSLADLQRAAGTLGPATDRPSATPEHRQGDDEQDQGRIGRRRRPARRPAGHGRQPDRAGSADPGLLGVARRLRHPLRRTRHPGAAARPARRRAGRVRPSLPGPPTAAGR